MVNYKSDDVSSESVIRSEHIGPAKTGDNIEAKRAANYVWDGANWQRMSQPTGGGTVTNDGTFAKETGGNLATIATNTTNLNNVTGSTASAVPTKAIYNGMSDGTNLVPLKNASSLGDAGGASYLATSLGIYNGSSFDRLRAANSGAGTTGTGVLGVGNLIFDGTNWQKQASTTAIGTVGSTSNPVNVGQQTSNTSAVQLSAASTVPTNGIIVQAISTNTASIFIGGSGVTTSTGFELQAGQAAPFTANLNTLYVIGSNNTDKVCWTVT